MRRIITLLLLCAGLIVVALGIHRPIWNVTVDIGNEGTFIYQGETSTFQNFFVFHAVEMDGSRSFRWTSERGSLTIPWALHQQPLTLRWRLRLSARWQQYPGQPVAEQPADHDLSGGCTLAPVYHSGAAAADPSGAWLDD
ncbi:MAG: hypothetical protein HC837_04635 [Chloroflexaceae bacterium]|nr:hypothetical protein [Chloroflexaceae bacterium]